MHDINLTRQLLIHLLNNRSPEFGARLKQQLSIAFERNGYGRFDEKAFGHIKFSDFLQNAFGDIVSIERRDGAGDILVYLKRPQFTPSLEQAPLAQPSVTVLPKVRNDVWQAFVNSDTNRKRFINRTTGTVRHYLQSESCEARNEVEASPGEFIEIRPIDVDTQCEWMRSFVENTHFPLKERKAIEALMGQPYSSNVNAMFTRALGEQGINWRHYRSKQIISRIKDWAKQEGVLFESLLLERQYESPSVLSSTRNMAISSLSPRQQAIKLLDILDEDDISRLVLPVIAASILVKPRS